MTKTRKDYNLLLELLDQGWEIDRFNTREVTLVPGEQLQVNIYRQHDRA